MSVLIYNAVPRPPVLQAAQWDGSDASAAAITQLMRLAVFRGSNPPAHLRPMTVEADWAVNSDILTVTVTTTLNGQSPNANPTDFNLTDWYLMGQGVIDNFSFTRDYVATVADQFSYEGH